jgi:glutamyl-tRNA synthetase
VQVRVAEQSDGRFAPSPTGPLHLGSLRTALVAWLCARGAGARFLVRVEDLDPQRSRRAFEAAQRADLRALGIDWDGPVVRQSERRERHRDALATLERLGRVYPCFCTRAEIREAASAPHGLGAGGYPGTCRALSDAERARRIAAGDRRALRLRADRARVGFRDRLLGERCAVVDDFVVRRADGVAAYQLAVVVDDAAQGIGEVVRGADLADSTPRHILLAPLLGLPVPRYAHVPLVLGADGRGWPSATARRRSPTVHSPSAPRRRCWPTRSGWRASAPGCPVRRNCWTSSTRGGCRRIRPSWPESHPRPRAGPGARRRCVPPGRSLTTNESDLPAPTATRRRGT